MSDFSKKVEATVYNFAFGDAWGYVTEFKKFKDIVKKQYQVPEILKVSDDTQMGIYTMKAMKLMMQNGVDFSQIDDPVVADRIRVAFANAYVMFYYDKDNDRAPGMTCMSALENYIYSSQANGLEGSSKNDSLGCGTIMRTPWIGLLPLTRREMAGLAILHSQTTHGHALSWITSSVLTLMIDDLLHNKNTDDTDSSMFDHAVRIVDEIRDMNLVLLENYSLDLVNLKQRLETFAFSWNEITKVLREVNGEFVDVNRVFGEGWTADESLYNALGICSLYNNSSEIYSGIRRLVYTGGDSDSIAAIAGSIYGAKYGEFAVSKNELINSLEPRYQDELADMIEFISSN